MKKYKLNSTEKTSDRFYAFVHGCTNFNLWDKLVLWLLGHTKK